MAPQTLKRSSARSPLQLQLAKSNKIWNIRCFYYFLFYKQSGLHCCREGLVSQIFDSACPLLRACRSSRIAVKNVFSWKLAHVKTPFICFVAFSVRINLLKYPPLSYPSDGLLSMAQFSFFSYHRSGFQLSSCQA